MNLFQYKLRARLILEGIQIKDFSKLNSDPEFQNACKLYASMIKNDNEAKTKFNLYNLDQYKQNHQAFIDNVQEAYQYIQEGRAFKKLLNKPLPEGVNLVYKDPNVLIISPEGYRNSCEAAHLDKSTAPWCVASPGSKAYQYYKDYDTAIIFYIYLKDQSYAMVVSKDDLDNIKDTGEFYFSQLENRQNDTFGEYEAIDENYYILLDSLHMSENKFKSILTDYILEYFKNKIPYRYGSQESSSVLINEFLKTRDMNLLEKIIKNNYEDSIIEFNEHAENNIFEQIINSIPNEFFDNNNSNIILTKFLIDIVKTTLKVIYPDDINDFIQNFLDLILTDRRNLSLSQIHFLQVFNKFVQNKIKDNSSILKNIVSDAVLIFSSIDPKEYHDEGILLEIKIKLSGILISNKNLELNYNNFGEDIRNTIITGDIRTLKIYNKYFPEQIKNIVKEIVKEDKDLGKDIIDRIETNISYHIINDDIMFGKVDKDELETFWQQTIAAINNNLKKYNQIEKIFNVKILDKDTRSKVYNSISSNILRHIKEA